ncbi:GGDEF domain-containing protein [Rhodococcus erythropolis]|uniref:GGDEF domain-containing protein n=1 Tax=Rhodococcus erythropolis TaxID=1833 RepID=UPI001BEAF52E|nr:GGDEF domain-containing protein [Rhodococcus erythropolis]MBT2267832.1 GGDEF domain-containing protein [Rhodococcus erythropolis]
MTSQMKSMRTLTREWLVLPDQYDRFTRYLRDNGLTTATRLLLGIIVIGLGVCALLNRFSPAGPTSPIALFFNTVVVIMCFLVGVSWWVFGPTKRRSFGFVVFCDIAVTISVVGDSSQLARLLTCVIFALIGIYIAYFHNPKLQIAHIAFSLCVIAVAAQPILFGPNRDPALGVSKVLVVITALVVCAFISQIVLTMLSVDASSSDIDPLTGLLNRRGLDRHVEKVLAEFQRQESAALLVIAIDIDRFKTINDVHGHDVGDRIILRVSQRLSAWAHADAVVARVGGDEFILVQRLPVPAIGPMLNSIGPAMHSNADDIPSTSSIGIAVRTHKFVAGEARAAAFTDMQRVADSAMYESKRLGGGRVHTIVTTASR